MSELIVVEEKFANKPIFAIWRADENGDKTGESPVVSFGVSKAQAILSYIDQIRAFLDKHVRKDEIGKIN